MLIWLHVRNSTQASLHSCCTYFSYHWSNLPVLEKKISANFYVHQVKSGWWCVVLWVIHCFFLIILCQTTMMLHVYLLFSLFYSSGMGLRLRIISAWGLTWKGFSGKPVDRGITASLRLSHTHVPGINKSFHSCWVTWCDTSVVTWQIWDSWAKSVFLLFFPLLMLHLLDIEKRWNPTLWALFSCRN